MSNWQLFQKLATRKMSEYLNVPLFHRNPTGFPKRFDMVSEDEQIVGDAKYLTLVRRERRPPAKFMEIAGHVWLLERVPAKRRFLVFGNQREVPEMWLSDYEALLENVEFYFLSNRGKIELLHRVG
jgi:hypothetical protein